MGGSARRGPRTQVIEAIRLAGLANQKGPRIQKVLKEITRERGRLDLSFLAELEDEEARAWLMKFKGVGPKTAAIVMQFSLNKPAFPVDTHIFRVSGRIGLRPPRMTVEQAHGHLASLLPREAYYAAHLNLIRLGREVCHARNLSARSAQSDDCARSNRRRSPRRRPSRPGRARSAVEKDAHG